MSDDAARGAVFVDATGRRVRFARAGLRAAAGLVALVLVAVVFSVTSGVRLPVLTPPVALPSQERPPKAPAHTVPAVARATGSAHSSGSTGGPGGAAGPVPPGGSGGASSPATTAVVAAASRSATPTPSAAPQPPVATPTPTPTPSTSHGRPTATTHGNAPSTPPGKTKTHP
jgi:hypothetical protein